MLSLLFAAATSLLLLSNAASDDSCGEKEWAAYYKGKKANPPRICQNLTGFTCCSDANWWYVMVFPPLYIHAIFSAVWAQHKKT